MTKNILILGANGFIGSDLVAALLDQTDYEIYALDLDDQKLGDSLGNPRLHFKKGDMTKETAWIDEHIQKCDVILPLAAIATPATYVKDPLRIFHLDFEANLDIVKKTVLHKKHLVFPSTSEVYGMCSDEYFDEETSNLTLGPINKERWIYSCSKQMLDRVIYAYGQHEGLHFTLFRPFNWMGPKQDDPKMEKPRAIPQFIGNIMRGEDIQLVNGGEQKRAFIYIDDAINCLVKIIQNKNDCASGKIFNIGNPDLNYSIREVAELVVKHAKACEKYQANAEKINVVVTDSDTHYGKAYQDVEHRVPSIKRASNILDWKPIVDMDEAIKRTVEYHLV